MRLAILLATTLLAPFPGAAAAPPAQVGITSFDQLAKPLPLPYDEKADADAAVTAARSRARAGGKLLLIDLGGNWCLDCRILAGTIEIPALKAFVDRHYEVVTVDIGRLDKNLQVLAGFGIKRRLDGVPALLVVDPRSGKLLDKGDMFALADARHMGPQALADWLAKWAR